MKVVLALVFLAVAQANHIQLFGDDFADFSNLATISPLMSRAMFNRFGFIKPSFDADFVSFARSVGVSDYPTMGHMLAMYDEPAVMFFMDHVGGIVSYYADAGIQNAMMTPELRAIFPSVLGAADSMAIFYHPDSILGSYKTILPGQFFVPSHSGLLAKFMSAGIEALPMPVEHVILRKPEIAAIFPQVSPIHARFDIDEFPFAYRSPVALSLFDAVPSAMFHPSSAVVAKSAFPTFGMSQLSPVFAKSASPLFGGMISPAYMKSAYPMVHEIPSFKSAFIPVLKFPLVKHLAAFDPLMYSKPLYKFVPHAAPITPIASVSSFPVVESSPIVDDLRTITPFQRAFPSFYPSYYPGFYPSTRFWAKPSIYPSSFFPSPIVPASAAGSSAAASSMASAAAGSDAATLF